MAYKKAVANKLLLICQRFSLKGLFWLRLAYLHPKKPFDSP